ncbi:MAG: hypothetical protein OHK93_008425 [Ramalina farinacea]|uniref:Uncharacterized protein n=1 Tax=Ramalina farinacea TaxID=258253 RepID=A0AA43QME3_9LECA|nr:hypothetical protein [Ramalina farinacea]
MSNNISLLDFIHDLPKLVWYTIKGFLMGMILLAAIALVICAAIAGVYVLCQSIRWVGPKVMEMRAMIREKLAERKAKWISRMVDQEAERQREEEVEMLGKGQMEGEGRMSGETLRGGENRFEGK